MSLKDKTIVVTGGSRGLGLGLVEALVDQAAKVTVVARNSAALATVKQRLGVAVIAADVTDEGAAQSILADVRPEVLVLNAGTPPRMGRLDQLSWADFTAPWETDVKGSFYWMQAALNQPLKPGSRVLVGSSGGPERIATLGRLRRRQAHALVHGQVRQRRLGAEESRNPFPGHCATADGRWHRHRRRGLPCLCGRLRCHTGHVSGPIWSPDAAPPVWRTLGRGAG
jgi:NAD(P)-dependent dehydrogenase (short-subunit alcohol dehydrogenase family)